jgi:hypothetical protein
LGTGFAVPLVLLLRVRFQGEDVAPGPLEAGPLAAITGFFTVRRVPWRMLWTVFSVFIN